MTHPFHKHKHPHKHTRAQTHRTAHITPALITSHLTDPHLQFTLTKPIPKTIGDTSSHTKTSIRCLSTRQGQVWLFCRAFAFVQTHTHTRAYTSCLRTQVFWLPYYLHAHICKEGPPFETHVQDSIAYPHTFPAAHTHTTHTTRTRCT